MKIVTTTVGCRGPEGERQNQERLIAAKRALEKAINLSADLIVLPGGFFTVGSSQAREAVAQSLVRIAKQLGIVVVLPHPEGPRNTHSSPWLTSKLISLTAFVPSGYTLVTFSSLIIAGSLLVLSG